MRERNLAAKKRSQEAELLAAARLLSWLVTAEKAAETAGPNLPGANAKTSATITATNASMEAYSVIACPERRYLRLVSDLNLGFIAQTLGAWVKYKRGFHAGG